MWIRVCNICGRRVDVDQRRIMIIKNAKILGFTQNQFYMEGRVDCKKEITICELCSRNNPIHKIWEMVVS